MYKITVNTFEEFNVMEKALAEYEKITQTFEKIDAFLQSKSFKLGDYVTKNSTSYYDAIFHTGKGEIGKIVGWDFEHGYYRVHYSKTNDFVGEYEKDLVKYEGEIPNHLLEVNPKSIERILVNLK